MGDWKDQLKTQHWMYLNDNLNIKGIVEQLYQGVDGKTLLTEALYGNIKSANNIPEANALYLNHLKNNGARNSFINFYTILRQTQGTIAIHKDIADRLKEDKVLSPIVGL